MTEQTTCEEAQKLRHEMQTCSAEKDQQINGLALQFNAMRGDLMRIDGDIKTLTVAVTDISRALEVIAHNTTAITEVIQVYNNFKGFGFVVKNIGVILIGSAALVTAVVFLTGIKIHIGA